MSKAKTNAKPTELLFFGDFNCTTGFGNVSKHLIDEWAKDPNLLITVFAINDQTEKSYYYKENVLVLPAYSTVEKHEKKEDVYCRIQFLRILFNNNFDVVFCLNDIEIFNQMRDDLNIVKNQKKKDNRPNFKSILYFPVDSAPRHVDLKILDFFDQCVTYTEYAKDIIKPLTSEANWKKVTVIPHGCNTEDFYPLSDEEKVKAKIKLLGEGNENKFVFGSVNRNSIRKDLASLIVGFSLFKHSSNADAVLYLHCNGTDPSGINIFRLCNRVGLQVGVDVILPENYSENKGYPVEELNGIYNAFDCFITTTTAEGWGLSVCEAMATKTLVVCPLHTSLTEITNNGENTLNFLMNQVMVFANDYEKIRFVCNPTEVSKLMGIVFNLQHESEEDQAHVQQKIENAHQKVSALNWKKIARQFKAKIDKLAK